MVAFKSSQMGPWQWAVSLLLLLATMINYMDRQTLSNLSPRIKDYFALSQEQYGQLEFTFGVSFAVGSLVFGALADWIPVRLLYPGVLLAWSAVGFATGLSSGFDSLFLCRTLLGFFEAGHWPCALVVTQAILTGSDRALGNSILQSGASLGAIVTPLIITALVAGAAPTADQAEAWRWPFLVIGSVGLLWAGLWLSVVKPGSIQRPQLPENSAESHMPGGARSLWLVETLCDRRFWALVIMVVCINGTWQLIRAWLTMFLQKGKGYAETTTLLFNSIYYVATDVGCLLAGATAFWLVRRGLTVHGSRLLVYGCCALLSALTCLAAILPASWFLLAVLLIVGAGTLGLFPCYYSFTQEINPARVGKMTGILSCLGWLISAPIHPIFGRYVDRTGSFDLGIALVGLAPLVGLVAMLVLWPTQPDETHPASPVA